MLRSPKFLADLLTAWRAVVALGVLVASWHGQVTSLPWVVLLIVLAWSGDMIDGWLARRGGCSPLSWFGQHDHLIDAGLATATLIYLWRIDLVSPWLLVPIALTASLVWYRLPSEWALMGFNTGTHVVALSALFSNFPLLASMAVGWGAMVALAGRQRVFSLLYDIHSLLNRTLHPDQPSPNNCEGRSAERSYSNHSARN